jgi:hypothetical protein
MQRVLVWLSAALVMLVGMGLLWLHIAGPARVPTKRHVVTTDPVIDEWRSASTTSASVVGQQPAQLPASAPVGPVASNDPDASVWDLCGIGRLPIPQALLALAKGGWAELPKHLGDTAQELGRERLLQALSQGDVRERAAGLLLDHGFVQRAAWAASVNTAQPTLTAAPSPLGVSDAITWQALLTMARSSGDAVIASWALATCRGDKRCQTQASAVWRQLEPSNAAAWMVEWQYTPGSPSSSLAAIAKAPRYSVHDRTLSATVLAAMPADVPPYVRQMLLIDVIGIEAAFIDIGGIFAMSKLCRSSTTGSQERTYCHDFAHLLTERGDSLLQLQIGLKLGTMAGWPQAELDRQTQEANALAQSNDVLQGLQPFSCSAVEEFRSHVRDVASKGELATLRALAARKAAKAGQATTPR